jgi:hypothetical protein
LISTKTVAKIPISPETLKTRFETTNIPIISKDFVSFFVSHVVGIRQFYRNKCHARNSTYVTISDEAFTVLTIENNWNRWACMAERQ